jgi:hypothetical protein
LERVCEQPWYIPPIAFLERKLRNFSVGKHWQKLKSVDMDRASGLQDSTLSVKIQKINARLVFLFRNISC